LAREKTQHNKRCHWKQALSLETSVVIENKHCHWKQALSLETSIVIGNIISN